jgi:endonuclease/exonuclease/phosphatase family metal-dependent hydrolase
MVAKLIVLVSVVLGLTWVHARCEDAAGIVFASYNVQSYVGEETGGGARASKPKPEASIQALVRIVAEVRPDILGLCEIGQRQQFEDFRARLAGVGLDFAHTEYVEGPDPDRHLALLSRFPITQRRSVADVSYELNGTLEKVKRGFLDVTVCINPAYEIRAVGAHLKSKLAVREGEALMRRFEAQLLRRHVDAVLLENPSTNLLVYGDLNESKNAPAIQEIVGVRGSAAYLSDLVPEDEHGDRWTHYWRTTDEYSRIDYLLASRALLPEVVKGSSRVHRSRDWSEASDHRPIYTTIVPVNRLR